MNCWSEDLDIRQSRGVERTAATVEIKDGESERLLIAHSKCCGVREDGGGIIQCVARTCLGRGNLDVFTVAQAAAD